MMNFHFARAARPALFPALLVILLAACGSLPHFGGGRSADSRAGAARMVFSPNGEPLTGGPLGHPGCGEAMDRWFGRVDANHDGRIDRDEFLADARAQFARMDLDHDGNITTDELATFRAPFRDDTPTAADGDGSAEGGGGRRRHDGGGGGARQSSAPPLGIGADPVMSADANVDFKVTLDEFLRQADEIYTSLASARDAGLSRDDARRGCAGGGAEEGGPRSGP